MFVEKIRYFTKKNIEKLKKKTSDFYLNIISRMISQDTNLCQRIAYILDNTACLRRFETFGEV